MANRGKITEQELGATLSPTFANVVVTGSVSLDVSGTGTSLPSQPLYFNSLNNSSPIKFSIKASAVGDLLFRPKDASVIFSINADGTNVSYGKLLISPSATLSSTSGAVLELSDQYARSSSASLLLTHLVTRLRRTSTADTTATAALELVRNTNGNESAVIILHEDSGVSIANMKMRKNATVPTSPAAGDQWYDTSANRWKYYNGTAWTDPLKYQ